MESDQTEARRQIDARRQIEDALLSYCRGIDRLDADALLAAFHPGAMLADYGADAMTIEAFAEYALPSLEKRFLATQHRMSNTAIDFAAERGSNGSDGSAELASAVVETYVLAFHIEAGAADEPDRLHTFNGRYIDRFEERDGRWLIANRTLRNDWSKVETVDETMGGSWKASGRAGSPDPLWD